jgi:molybdate transport system ATP-binding protein
VRFEIEARVARGNGFALEAAERCEAEALGLVGPSGCGKSTLLDAVAGVEPGARVVLDGVDCSRMSVEERAVGYVTQDALLFPHLTVRENLLYSPRAQGLGDVPEALGIARLLDRRPRSLSGGERRRAALARAILSRPRLLLLDEPFGGLDETRRREAMALLDQVRRSYRIPMILVSHLADEVIGLTDRAIRLEDGRVVARGTSASVLRASETGIDNYFTGTVVGPGKVRAGGVELAAALPESASGELRLACYAHDVLLARGAPEGLSARNLLRTRISAIVPAGGSALVDLEGLPFRALLTADAVESLALKAGDEVHAVVKATSIACVGRTDSGDSRPRAAFSW